VNNNPWVSKTGWTEETARRHLRNQAIFSADGVTALRAMRQVDAYLASQPTSVTDRMSPIQIARAAGLPAS